MLDEEEIVEEELSKLEAFIAEKKKALKQWQERRKKLKKDLRKIQKEKESE